MTAAAREGAQGNVSERASEVGPWLPLVVIVLAQLQMGINVNALPVSLGPIAEDLDVAPTAVGTALVLYSLAVAALVMLGAKIGNLIGARIGFQLGVLGHGVSMFMMGVSTDESTMNAAQVVAGVSAALLVPTLVVLIAANYWGRQKETALGVLAAVPAVASAVAFLLAGWIATTLSWRYSFGLVVFLSIAVLILSFRMNPVPRQTGVRIDFIGVLLSASAISALLFGFNNLRSWGGLMAKDTAPFSIIGISPAPIMILGGIVLGQAFFAWSESRTRSGRAPLLAPEVLDSPEERNAIIAFLVAGGLGPAVSFLIPLYIQIVQDRSPLFSSVAILPYAITIAAAAVLSVRLYDRVSPRTLGVISFVIITAGLVLVASSINNGWGNPMVVLGLLLVGTGEGTLLTLLFNVLVSASPKHLSGDVGALRGVANNVASALGSAFAGVVAVGILAVIVTTAFNRSDLPPSLEQEINLDRVDFVTNDQLRTVLTGSSVTPEEVDQAIAINEDARLRSLRASFLILAGISLLAIFPATRLPKGVQREEAESEAEEQPAVDLEPVTVPA